MRNVISAVEIIVDKDLPVAMNVVRGAGEEVKLADAKRPDPLDQSSEKFLKRHSVGIEIYEDEALPYFDANRHQTVLSTIKVLHTFELRHAFQRPIQTVVPTVV